jgi:hypothetical protein
MLRYCPHLPLPSYRYIPGQDRKDEHRTDIPKINVLNLSPDRWRENEAYLYGIDLYHQSFFYEAHEVWEELWKKVGIKTTQGQFLKALIQNAAAELKLVMKQSRSAERMKKRAQELLEEVLASGECNSKKYFMGIQIPEFLKELKNKTPPPIVLSSSKS